MQIHPPTAFLVVGFLLIALPMTAWSILRRRHSRLTVGLWCVGTALQGIAFAMIGARGSIPDWLSFPVANALGFAAWALLALSLRRELESSLKLKATALGWLAVSAVFLLLYVEGVVAALRISYVMAVYLAGAAGVSHLAWRLFRLKGYRSAALVSAAYAFFGSTLIVRLLAIAADWRGAAPLNPTLDFALTFVSCLAAALYGNLGFIGIALERWQARATAQSVNAARETERRVQTELRLKELGELLGERERLLTQREELLGALAHEVRQPLNNASAALQAAEAALAADADERSTASARLQRARGVLANVVSAVDNTLADAVLLTGTQPVFQTDSDIELLISSALADLPQAARDRIRVERLTSTRTAEMHSGLMRLALRNLLGNATAYSPPDSLVTLRIDDSDEPLALVIDVCDTGPGIPADLLPRLFQRGARGPHPKSTQSHGLGLYIVRRVMELHLGKVEIRATGAEGTTVRMHVPQGALG
jgi:signal transduction histidine kinase